MKKKVKEQLRSDEFVSIVNRAIEFTKSRTRELTILAGVMIFMVLVFLGVKYIQAKNAKKESNLLAQIFKLENELKDNPEKLPELENLGGNGKFSRVAHLKVATYAFEAGDMDKTLEALEKIPQSRKDLIYYQAQDLKAQVKAAQNQYDEALAIYQRIENADPDDYSLDVILFQMAKILVKKNDTAQALALYKRIQEEFPQTYYGYEASAEAMKLESKK